jgi:hypothetical protein
MRRALLLVTLVLLFAGSLGFAEMLVRRHTPAAVHVTWNIPQDFKRMPGGGGEGEGVEVGAAGAVGGRQREVLGLVTDIVENATGKIRLQRARQLFTELFGVDATLSRSGMLGGRAAVEVETTDARGRFAILRLTAVAGKAVAICYSGAGPITDGDRSFFNQLCGHVEIRSGPGVIRSVRHR